MSLKKEIPPKEEIYDLYSKPGVSISELARIYNTSNPTIRKWLDFYAIERKDHKTASTEVNTLKNKNIPDKKQFLDLYEKMSIKDLETYYSVSQNTIYKWMDLLDIEVKTHSEACAEAKSRQHKKIQYEKEYILSLYDFTKPLTYNADLLNISVSHLRKLLKKYDIELPVKYRSEDEIKLYDYCVNLCPEDIWEHSNKTLIYPYELDIVNHTKKVAFEYCGLYWHSENSGGKNRKYHKNKYDLCKENGYRLITIFESDDKDKVKYFISNLIGNNKRIFARNTICKQIDIKESKLVLEESHMNGFVGASHHYGLFYQNELIMVMTFGKSRFNKDYNYEIIRMASKKGITVVGGASKIFNKFVEDNNVDSCMTFADLRYGDGKVYEKCGFEFIENTEPNYWYYHKNFPNKLYSRVKFQKHKLEKILKNYNSDITEYENMLNNNWDRIWDCGNAKYGWKNKKGD